MSEKMPCKMSLEMFVSWRSDQKLEAEFPSTQEVCERCLRHYDVTIFSIFFKKKPRAQKSSELLFQVIRYFMCSITEVDIRLHFGRNRKL